MEDVIADANYTQWMLRSGSRSAAQPSPSRRQHRHVPCLLCSTQDEAGASGAGPVEPEVTAPRTPVPVLEKVQKLRLLGSLPPERHLGKF